VGLDFHGHPFWDKYIDFEERIGESTNVVKIYERLTHLPTYQFNRYYEKFRAQITGNTPVESLTDSETLERIQDEIKAEGQTYPDNSPELERLLRTKIDAYYYEIYHRTQAEVTKRWTYEGSIKRAYFHVTEVDEAELVNWRKYLDFEEGEGDNKRTAFLYERCLVACALHEEFWLRYARWMFAQGKDEDARIIYMRASGIYVPIAEPTVRLHWARFEEKLENIGYANLIHEQILEELPGHVETMISWAGVQRRHHGDQAALDKLEELIKVNENVAGRLTAEQARILWQCSGDIDKARQLFKDRSGNFPESRDFWLDYLRFEIAQPSLDQDEAHSRIKAVYDLMRSKARFSPETMKELSHCYMAYLLDRGSKKAAKEYMLLDKEVNGYV
jgi:pre-mRNA-processing factor 39